MVNTLTMPYISLDDLRGRIPEEFLTEALDDDNDGVIDAWPDVESQAAEKVDAYLSARYPVPVQRPIPPIVKQSTIAFACELCYTRRGQEENPFTTEAGRWRTTLERIAAGTTPLQLQTTGPEPGSVITHPSTLGDPRRRIL